MRKGYRPYLPEQELLLPPNLKDWLAENHLAYFVSDVVDQLELSAIHAVYEKDPRGQPPYDPRMMTKVLVYAYCVGVYSARKIQQRLSEDVAFRVLAAGNAPDSPDFRTIADFRKIHLEFLEKRPKGNKKIEGYLATERQKHGEKPLAPRGPLPKDATRVDRMRRKLQTKAGAAIYAARKTIVEPVFGQIKEARGFRRFSLRGVAKVRAEWALVCATHNILKMYRICYG